MNRGEIESWSDEALQAEADRITTELARVKEQIGRAKAEAAEFGNYADPDWFHRATTAMRLMGRDHQLVLSELGARKKAERRRINAAIESCFIAVARRKLDPETFMSLMEEAQYESRALAA